MSPDGRVGIPPNVTPDKESVARDSRAWRDAPAVSRAQRARLASGCADSRVKFATTAGEFGQIDL